MASRVFIAYHKRNKALVSRLHGDLVTRGIPTWIDSRDMPPVTSSKRKTIYDAIVACDCFLSCLSPEFLQDEECRTQLFWARAHEKRLLPVLVSDEWPYNHVQRTLVEAGNEHSHAVQGIEELLYLDFSGRHDLRGATYEDNFARLVDSILRTPKPSPINSALTYFSYYWKDADWVNRIAREVELARGNVWIDTLAIRAGDYWRSAMYAGLRRADNLVVSLSPEAARSKNVLAEILLARMRDLRILPVISDRVAKDEARKAELSSAIRNSKELQFLDDMVWLEPVPDYQALLTTLKAELGLLQAERRKKSGIFLSYRRTESQPMTGRIYDALADHFGRETLFRDVNTIPPGEDFAAYYGQWLRDHAAVMLVIIGETWASTRRKPDEPPRILNPDDDVRIEVTTGLKLDGLRVIPVLVGNAEMPNPEDLPDELEDLAQRNAVRVRNDPDFWGDIANLVKVLRSPSIPTA